MTGTTNKSLADRIIKASLVVGVAHLCLKFAGLIQAKAAAQFLSTSEYEAIFVVAFQAVIYTIFLIGEEVVGPSLMPVFVREIDEKGESAAWSLAGILVSVQVVIILIVTGIIMLQPDFFIRLLTDAFNDGTMERVELLRESLIWLAPCLIFLSIGSSTYILLNSYKRFFLAALGDSAWKLGAIIALIAGIGAAKLDYHILFIGLLIGCMGKLAIHIYGLRDKLKLFRVSFDIKSPAFKAMLLLMLPLIAGILFAKFRDTINNAVILDHLKQAGTLQANDMGRKLFSAIQWLIPFTLQIALFPFLCDLVDKNDFRKLGEVLGKSCRLLLALFIPGALCLAVLSERTSVLIFLGGKTGLQVSLWAGLSNACYLLVLPAAALECVLMQGFFANRKMVSVTVIGICSSLLSVVISYVFIIKFKVEPVQGLAVVALGFVISKCIKNVVLLFWLKRTVPMLPFGGTVGFVLKLVVLAVFVGATTWGSSQLLSGKLDDGLEKAKLELSESHIAAMTIELEDASEVTISKSRVLINLAVSAIAGAIAYILGAWVLRLDEPKLMLTWLWERVAGKLLR